MIKQISMSVLSGIIKAIWFSIKLWNLGHMMLTEVRAKCDLILNDQYFRISIMGGDLKNDQMRF